MVGKKKRVSCQASFKTKPPSFEPENFVIHCLSNQIAHLGSDGSCWMNLTSLE
jgi:hypothetical protein